MGTEFDESDMYEDSKFMSSWDQSRKPDMDDYLSYLEGSCIYTESEWESEKKLRSSYFSTSCKICKGALKLYRGERREYFACEETPECRIQQIALPQCPSCYSSMGVYEDPSGRYLQCLRYNADLEEGEEKCFNREKNEFKPCPICGSPLVKTYNPNLYWECIRFPQCYGSPDRPPEKDFRFPLAWITKGKSESDNNRAIECFDEALKIDSDNLEARHYKAIFLINNGKLEDKIADDDRTRFISFHEHALRSFEKAVRTDPHNAEGWYCKAQQEEIFEKYQDALQSYMKFVMLSTHQGGSQIDQAHKKIKQFKSNGIVEKVRATLNEGEMVVVEGGPGGDFLIAATQVTFEQYDRFCDATGHIKPEAPFGRGMQPVVNVSIFDAMDYCKWLSKQTGTTVRLPEEIEWEFAARGGKKSEECVFSGSNNIGVVAWFDKNSNNKTHEVGIKDPNELGIFDMSGNVWEMCGNLGNHRGGSWMQSENYCKVTSRGGVDSLNLHFDDIGFRPLQKK